MSQDDLARELGVTRGALAKWELGKADPDSDTLIRIATYFGVTVGYLLGVEDQITERPSSNRLQPLGEMINLSLSPLLEKMFKDKRLRSTPQIVLFTGLTSEEIEKLRKGVSPAAFPEERMIKFFRKFDIEDIRAYYETAGVPLPQEFQDVEAEFRKALRKVHLYADRSPETMEYVIQMVREEFDDLED